MFTPILVSITFDLFDFFEHQSGVWYLWLFPLSGIVLFVSSLAETNRTPFDFAEGESELVSGYNTEYGRGGFALLMLAEYTRILFMSMLFVIIFIGVQLYLSHIIMFLLLRFLFV